MVKILSSRVFYESIAAPRDLCLFCRNSAPVGYDLLLLIGVGSSLWLVLIRWGHAPTR